MKVTLDAHYTLYGQPFGPGVVEVPDSLLEDRSALSPALLACIEGKPESGSESGEKKMYGKPLSFYRGMSRDELVEMDGIGESRADKILLAFENEAEGD